MCENNDYYLSELWGGRVDQKRNSTQFDVLFKSEDCFVLSLRA